ncbi:unannotated protein [freshwater metagenome]|uniref:Unannotated protein n=1 Tax=freshwater metagenome TaxID=449393 RepID=A0A6J7PI64_9ZZZZ
MGGPQRVVVVFEHQIEAGEVVGHVAVGRRDDRCRPPHDVVAAKQHVLLAVPEAEVVRDVTGGVQYVEGPTRPFDDVAGGDEYIGYEREVGPLLDLALGLALLLGFAGERVGAERVHRGVDARVAQHRRGRGVIAVGVRDEDRDDLLAAECAQQCLHVRRVSRPGVDDRNLAPADDVGAGAVERERARVVREHASDMGRHRVGEARHSCELPDVGYHRGHVSYPLLICVTSPVEAAR